MIRDLGDIASHQQFRPFSTTDVDISRPIVPPGAPRRDPALNGGDDEGERPIIQPGPWQPTVRPDLGEVA
ncbi:hypothetical protein ACQSSU_06780 [Micromonospora echinospora]